SHHIIALGRFLAKLHKHTYKKSASSNFLDSYEIPALLNYTKIRYFSHYKKLQFLEFFEMQNDGFIHGDIFKDNTVFDGNKIGVFDFIDSGSGSFSFDCAVGLVGFDVVKHHHYFINIFLIAYNQHAPKKLKKGELIYQIKVASRFYALLRINKYKKTKNAKELMNF
ncbi:MAG: phosphotransferase, partial [Campylobacterota bacterium]|nr:phosphotransferase [Campylobacterota bacterium]